MPSERKSVKWIRRLLTWSALGLITTGVGFVARIPWAYLQADFGERLVNRQAAVLKPAAVHPDSGRALPQETILTNQGLFPQAAGPTVEPSQGTLIGHLVIPSLHLSAPLVEGTALSILAESAGHLANSVLPGQVGTTVLAAHDVTYFHHIDALRPGQKIEVFTSQGQFIFQVQGHRVVTVGENVVATRYPSLVLETCYPLNALTPVNQRYLVFADLVSSALHASTGAKTSST